MKSSGGLLSEICNIINVLEGFLRGHNEAMLVLQSDGSKLVVFRNS